MRHSSLKYFLFFLFGKKENHCEIFMDRGVGFASLLMLETAC